MGCGESKHDVATGNTISRKKSNVGEQAKKSKGTKDNETDSLLVLQQKDDQTVKDNNGVNGDQPAAEGVKDIAGNMQRKKGYYIDNNEEKQEAQEPAERFISKESPNRYFSSRKEEESVEGIASEGRSEKSMYDSPRPEAGKDSLFNFDNEKVDNAVEGKTLAEEIIPENEKAEGVSVKKEVNLAKETEQKPATAIEAQVLPAAGAEKNLDNAEKEQSVASPTKKDLKCL